MCSLIYTIAIATLIILNIEQSFLDMSRKQFYIHIDDVLTTILISLNELVYEIYILNKKF